MTADDLIKVIGAISGAAALVGLPAYLKTRRPAVTSDSVAKMIVAERDRLQARIDALETKHAAELIDVEARARAELALAQSQVTMLQTRIDALYQRLYQMPQSPPPIV